nr:hypothetical protein [Luteibacter rhizovicinus]
MTDYSDIRETTRQYRHAGKEFSVTVFRTENGVFVDSVKVEGMDRVSDRDSGGHEDIEDAFAAGERFGRELIG